MQRRIKPISRRLFLAGGATLGFGATSVMSALAASLAPTPRQPAGPFYAPLKPLSIDSDLVLMPGKTEPATGERLYVRGRLLDPNGAPIRGARVEVWQANTYGRYNHPRHRNTTLKLDPNFQGFGHAETGADGDYVFRTIKPGEYLDSPGWRRPPHIHFAVFVPDTPPWTTQMYFPGEALNDGDRLLNAIPAESRGRVIATLSPAEAGMEPEARVASFDIVLGAPGTAQRGI